MAFDGIVLYGAIHEIKKAILDSKIDKIYQTKKDELIFFLRKPQEEYKLLISANPDNCRMHLISAPGENPKSPPMFCMLLRKHLGGGKIHSISQKGLERAVEIIIQNQDEFMQPVEYKLIVEIMGKHSNIILVNSSKNVILDAVKRVPAEVNRYREILPGEVYIDPPLQQKNNILEINHKDIMSIYNRSMEIEGQKPLGRWIIDNFGGFSGSAAQEIAYRAEIPHHKSIASLNFDEISKISQELIYLGKKMKQQQFTPSLYIKNNNEEPLDFWVFPLTSKKNHRETLHPSVNKIIDMFYNLKFKQQTLNQAKHNLRSKMQKHLEKLRQNLNFSRKKLNKTKEMDKYKLWGEILSAYLYKISPGTKQVTLPNFYEDGQEITIPLNEKLTPAHNAQVYFDRYKKLQSTKKIVEKRMQNALQEIDYVENVLVSIENSEQIEDLLEIEHDLKNQGYIKLLKDKSPHKSTPSEPLKFTSSDGFIIRVGKNNRQNEALTKQAKSDDIWLHTKNIPGSHVIIESHGKKVSEKTLLEAAILAAYFSKSRNSSNVPVDYTYVRHVKKPSGSKPGFVIYYHQKTLYVTPERSIVDKLSL